MVFICLEEEFLLMIFALLLLNRRASSARINVQIVGNQFGLDEALFRNRKRLINFKNVVLMLNSYLNSFRRNRFERGGFERLERLLVSPRHNRNRTRVVFHVVALELVIFLVNLSFFYFWLRKLSNSAATVAEFRAEIWLSKHRRFHVFFALFSLLFHQTSFLSLLLSQFLAFHFPFGIVAPFKLRR